MKKVRIIEFDEECPSCCGTGLFTGFAEAKHVAVVCRDCKGTGCHRVKFAFKDFTGRRKCKAIKRVYQTNPGIGLGCSAGGTYKLEDFGGMSLEDWVSGKKFVRGTECRKFTCPAWWYQGVDYKKMPKWKECMQMGSFNDCEHFSKKEECWKRFDKGKK